ncbi:MAG: hypothetical protein R3B06_22810 [Kofleriaceae bacterium]
MRRLSALAVALTVAGCPGRAPSRRTALVDSLVSDRGDRSGILSRELADAVRQSYDEPGLDAAAAAAVIDPSVGLVAFGIGPTDVSAGRAPTARWPVSTVGDRPVRVVSRALEVHLSTDQRVGWAFDEASLELPVCGRTASIPIRVFQVYVRDTERWTLVAEHLAYPQAMGRWLDAAVGPDGARLPESIERQPEAVAARAAIAEAIAPDGDRAATWDASPDALAVWPDPLQVMRGVATRVGPSLATSLEASKLELGGLRLALGPGRATAIASATLIGQINRVDRTVPILLRATLVLEQAGATWRVRAAMASVPITVGALVGRTVGIAASTPQDGVVSVACR